MKAIISGQAGVALLPDRPARLIRIGQPEITLRDIQEAVRCFDGADDAKRHQLSDLSDVRIQLAHEDAFSDALKLLLFFLDPSESEEDVTEYAECIEEVIQTPEVFLMLERRMYSSPLPFPIEVNHLTRATKNAPSVIKFVCDIISHQAAISRICKSFEELSPSLFESGLQKERARQHLSDWGAFLLLSKAVAKNQDLSFLRLQISAKFGYWKEAIALWTAKIRPGVADRSAKADFHPAMMETDDEDTPFVTPHLPSHVAYQQVRAQQVAIVQRLKDRDVDGARRFTDELIQRQRNNSTAEQIAKSLSYLATQAKRQEVPELQVEWAAWAERENPEDPLTSGHLADAFITVGNYGEAEQALDRTASFGNQVYAATGRGRILRALGRYEEARASFLETTKDYEDQDGVEYAHAGAAETLRDQGRYIDALEEYKNLTDRWPFEETFWNGYASTLVDLGRFQEALVTFGKAGAKSPVTKNGKASVYRQGGKFLEAAALYDEVIEEFPNNHVALTGRAEVLRLNGALEDAAVAYRVAVERCPFIPYPILGLGNTLSEMRNFAESVRVLKNGVEQFPDTPSLQIGLAKSLRRSGDTAEALRITDICLRRFPADTQAWILKSTLLNECGQNDEAIAILKRTLSEHPYSFAASTKLAALLIECGDIAGARALLPEIEPRSSWDWTRFILRAEIEVLEHGAGKASRMFERGVSQCPFHRQRVLLRSAWASAELGRRRWREARRLVDAAPLEIEPIVRLSVYAATHRPGLARIALQEVMDTNHVAVVVNLADEIAKRHGLRSGKPVHDFDWIIRTQRTAILLEAA
jgi:tetratricopeptide (TPR) repeat protein